MIFSDLFSVSEFQILLAGTLSKSALVVIPALRLRSGQVPAGIQPGTGCFFVFEEAACPPSGAGFRLALDRTERIWGGYRPGEEKMYRETFFGWFRFACITKNLGVVCSDRSIAQRYAACKCGGASTVTFSEFRKHGSTLSKRSNRQLDQIWLIGIATQWAKGIPFSRVKQSTSTVYCPTVCNVSTSSGPPSTSARP
jgi:hypothetical protein